jgi:hypothetical protein
VVLTVDDRQFSQTLQVEADPVLPDSVSALDLLSDEEQRALRKELEQEWDLLHEEYREWTSPDGVH